MTPDLDKLHRLLDLVGAKCSALPEIDVNDRASYDRRHAAALQAFKDLEDEGARWRNDFAGARLALAGVTATSTTGPVGAMKNWLIAANRRITKLEAGGSV